MATKIENIQDSNSCWNRASDEEQVFVFRQHDRHAPALIRLWAEMREREGEDAAVVNSAREVAQLMEDESQAQGRVVLSLDAVAAFTTTLKKQTVNSVALEEDQAPPENPNPYNLKLGDIVVAGRGRPARLVRIFGADEKTDERVRGMANIQLPGTSPVTVEFGLLRRALPEEVEAYRNVGGRM